MAHTLEALCGIPKRDADLDRTSVGRPEPGCDELTQLCNEAALEMVPESIVFFSARTSRLVHANRAAADCLGYPQDQLLNLSLLEIAPQASSVNLAALHRRAMRRPNQEARVRTVYRHRSGSLIPVDCTIRAVRVLPESIFVAIGHGAEGSGSASPRRLTAVSRDSLTLLPNRDWLWRQLEREIRMAWQSDYQFAVLFIDIDRFKDINDVYGHLAGDRVLQSVAHRLAASVRPEDVVTRYGGDEFVVLIKDVRGEEDVWQIAERIVRRLEVVGDRRRGKAWRARVTVSIGAAISGGPGLTSIDAIERADRAMYRAKALGRNGRFVIDVVAANCRPSTRTPAQMADRTKQLE
jgi:diguanylate cyclase (GGDEF)-like protein/PAS domain S-box-containing protein